jgi:hypothetical protein
MELLLWLGWLAMGAWAVGLANYDLRYKYPELYIQNYWSSDSLNEFNPYNGVEFAFFFLLFLSGPIAFAVAMFMTTRSFGVSYLFRKWTQEEAKVLFPNNYNYETKMISEGRW